MNKRNEQDMNANDEIGQLLERSSRILCKRRQSGSIPRVDWGRRGPVSFWTKFRFVFDTVVTLLCIGITVHTLAAAPLFTHRGPLTLVYWADIVLNVAFDAVFCVWVWTLWRTCNHRVPVDDYLRRLQALSRVNRMSCVVTLSITPFMTAADMVVVRFMERGVDLFDPAQWQAYSSHSIDIFLQSWLLGSVFCVFFFCHDAIRTKVKARRFVEGAPEGCGDMVTSI